MAHRDTTLAFEGARTDVPPARWRSILRFTSNPLVAAGLVICTVVVVIAIVAPWLAPYDPFAQDFTQRVNPPSAGHWFGTDEFGRDIFSRVLYGARVTVVTSSAVVLLTVLAGTTLGLISGYVGGFVDSVIMRVMDVLMAFPGILLAIAVMALLGQGIGNLILALGIAYTPAFARVARSAVLSLRHQDFIEAARALGARSPLILVRHVLPNAMAPLLIQMSITFVYAIRAEASLSYLGLGTPPPNPSWGNLLQETQKFMIREPILPFFPGLAIAITILGLNLLGDGLRDVLDPRLRGTRWA